MEREYSIILLLELLENKEYSKLRSILVDTNEVDVADFLAELKDEQIVLVFRMLPKDIAADVFSNLDPDIQELIIGAITDKELSYIIEELYLDDAVELVDELPANVVKRVLKAARPETKRLIDEFLNYPENSAGRIMTAEFVDLRASMTVSGAIERIRKIGADSELIYTCYVIDNSRVLEGVVTVKDLLLASDDSSIMDLMETDIISVATTDDQEEAAQQMMKYDFISLPVVDQENRLVGIVTFDDVMDIMEQEATEDFERMAAMAPSEKPYLKTSPVTLAKNRIVWLLVLMISSMITGGILAYYESAFATIPMLVTFIPMLMDTGGNSGSQSSTMIIRGLAIGEIELKDFGRVLWKELRVGFMAGGILSLVNFVRLMIMHSGDVGIALTVSITLYAVVIIAKTIGGIFPMLAKKLGADPALMASPMITTIVDALALLIFFTIAQTILM